MSTEMTNGNDRYEARENRNNRDGNTKEESDVILTVRVLMHGKVRFEWLITKKKK